MEAYKFRECWMPVPLPPPDILENPENFTFYRCEPPAGPRGCQVGSADGRAQLSRSARVLRPRPSNAGLPARTLPSAAFPKIQSLRLIGRICQGVATCLSSDVNWLRIKRARTA